MNAPWKADTGARDAFAAFVCDDATLDLVRPVAIELGWEPERCARGTLRDAVQALSVASSPQILLVDLSESADPLGDINALAEVCEPGTVVLAAGRLNDIRLYRDLIGSGIHDYLLKPLAAEGLRAALVEARAAFAAPRPAAEESDRPAHRTIAVIGARGGVGASTIATSLAWLLSTAHAQQTALLDLDVHFGTSALAFDLEPGRGLTDAIDNPGRIDGLFLERATIRANDRLAILSAEAPINRPLLSDGAAFGALLTEFRHAFAATVLDLPRQMAMNFPQLLGDVGTVVLVTEPTLAAARDTIRLLGWLKAQAPGAETLVVANKLSAQHAEIARGDFEASIEHPLAVAVPADPRAAAGAAKLGRALADAGAGGKAAAAIRALATLVLGGADAAAAARGGGSPFARLAAPAAALRQLVAARARRGPA